MEWGESVNKYRLTWIYQSTQASEHTSANETHVIAAATASEKKPFCRIVALALFKLRVYAMTKSFTAISLGHVMFDSNLLLRSLLECFV